MSLLLSSLFKHHNLLLHHSLLHKPTTHLTKIITSKSSSHITKSFSSTSSEMVKAIRVHELGGPQVKNYDDVLFIYFLFVLCFLFSHVTLLT